MVLFWLMLAFLLLDDGHVQVSLAEPQLCDLVGVKNCTIDHKTPKAKDELCRQVRDYVSCVELHISGCSEKEAAIYMTTVENLKAMYSNNSFHCQFTDLGGHLVLQGPPHDVVGEPGRTIQIYCNVVRRLVSQDTSMDTGLFTLRWLFTPVNGSERREVLSLTGIYHKSWRASSTNWSKYNNTQGKQLSILDLDFTDAGTYTCELTDSSQTNRGTQTAQAQVFIIGEIKCTNERPVIRLMNESDNEALFSCDVRYTGGTPPNITWMLHQQQLMEMEETVGNGSVTSRLAFPVSAMDRGNSYRCHVQYQPAQWERICQPSISLNIELPVHVTSLVVDPHAPSFHRGEKVHLYCAAQGNPAPSFAWKFRPANSSEFHLLSHFQYHLIPRLEEGTAGWYECFVSNVIEGQSFSDKKIVYIIIEEESSTDGHVMVPPNRWFPSQTKMSPYAIGAMVSAGLAIILIVVFVFLAVKLKKREHRMREKLARDHDETLDDQEVELLDENIQPRGDDLPIQYSNVRHNWEILRRDVRLLDMIGKGSFTEVWKGRMRRHPNKEDTVKVAVKRPAVEASDKEKRFFSAELEVLKMLQSHPNIVHLMGCYTKSEPHLMILEYAAEDTLHTYLQLHRPGKQEVSVTISGDQDSQAVRLHTKALTPQKMIHLAAQIIHALQHLTKFKLVSYRLRAAGVLVVRGGICKLSGFGFPQDILERNVYEAASAPIRWMAPESLSQHVFDTHTDIWAFGVVLWEILHFGMTPYPTLGPHEVAEKVQCGDRMTQPSHCSNDLYKVMLSCWHPDPDQRLMHSDLLQILEQFAACGSSHIRFEKMADYLKSMAPIPEESPTEVSG